MDEGFSALSGKLTLSDLTPRHLEGEGAWCSVSTWRPSLSRYRLALPVPQIFRLDL